MIDWESDDPVTVSQMKAFQECLVADLKMLRERTRALAGLMCLLYFIQFVAMALLIRGVK